MIVHGMQAHHLIVRRAYAEELCHARPLPVQSPCTHCKAASHQECIPAKYESYQWRRQHFLHHETLHSAPEYTMRYILVKYDHNAVLT